MQVLQKWNKFVNQVKSLIIIISQMGFFKMMTISMWQIKILTSNHFQMEDNKKCDVGHFLIPFKTFIC
jgi:hypothetical protein